MLRTSSPKHNPACACSASMVAELMRSGDSDSSVEGAGVDVAVVIIAGIAASRELTM